jgi:hypothetical protein
VSHGSGLLALRERVRLAGGVLDAGPRDGGFAVTARLPLTAAPTLTAAEADDGAVPAVAAPGTLRSDGRAAATTARPGIEPSGGLAGAGDGLREDGGAGQTDRPADAARRLREARRRARRSLLVAFGAPAGLALVLALVYYPLATAGAVLDRSAYERLRLGEERADLGLPRRQADPPAGTAPGCEFYTDGNFPFAEPTWRLCFTDGRLVSKERIAQ